MKWKYELIVTSKELATKLKEEIMNIDSDIIVNSVKIGSNYNVKSSIENIQFDLDHKNSVIRKLKTIYEKYRNQIYEQHKPESNNKNLLENMIRNIIKEVKDELVPYIIKYTYVDFKAKRRSEGRMNWDEKRLGKPTEQSLKKFRDDFNKSMENGANKHLATTQSGIGTLTAIDQRTGKVVAKYTPPSFEMESVKQLKESSDISHAIDSYIEKLNTFTANAMKKSGYTLEPDIFEKSVGAKWIKITTTNLGGKGQKSVFAFVDPNTGDIYKPAGWNAPAKGIRGNVNDVNPPLTMRALYK